jgi:hypothetical protein
MHEQHQPLNLTYANQSLNDLHSADALPTILFFFITTNKILPISLGASL